MLEVAATVTPHTKVFRFVRPERTPLNKLGSHVESAAPLYPVRARWARF